MNIVAYIISAMVITSTLLLLTFTIIPLIDKSIKLDNKKTWIWFSVIMITFFLEILSIIITIIGEVSEYITPAPSYIWLIFKIFSLIFLWIWSFFYFFMWLKFKKNKKN